MSSKQAICPQCGGPVSPTAKFCRTCGRRLNGAVTALSSQAPATMQPTCPHCGAMISPSAKFCAVCGKPSVIQTKGAVHATPSPKIPSAKFHGIEFRGIRIPFTLAVGAAALLVLGVLVIVSVTVFRGGLSLSQPAKVSPVVGKTLVSQNVSPSNQSQSISAGDAITVILPANLLDKPQTVTISESTNPPPVPVQGMELLASYDIKLGEQTQLSQPLMLELAFDPKKVTTTDNVGLAYWSDDGQTWVIVPSQVDTSRNVIVGQTKHLSHWSTFYLSIGWVPDKSSEHFTVVYKPNTTIRYDKPAPGTDKSSGVAAGDLGGWLDDFYGRYKSRGFPVPQDRQWVFLGQASGYWDSVTEAQRSTLLGNMLFPEKFDDLETAKFDAAHELFHVVQSQTYNMTYNVLFNRWFFDATADYAAGRIAQSSDRMGKDIDARYLESSITAEDDVHEYSTSHFFDYLVTQAGMDFIDMWSAIAKSSTGTKLGPLDDYLKGKFGATNGLDYQYRQFARYFIFDASSPLPAPRLKGEHLAKRASEPSCAISFTPSQTEATCTLVLDAYYTSKLWGVVPQLASGETTRQFRVERIEGNSLASVYLLKGNERTSKPEQSYVGGFDSGAVMVTAAAGDGLYIQAYNTSSKTETVKFRISASAPIELTVTPGSATVKEGESFTFTATAHGIPSSVKKLEWVWDGFSESPKTFSKNSGVGETESQTAAFQFTPADTNFFGIVYLYDATTSPHAELAHFGQVLVQVVSAQEAPLEASPIPTEMEAASNVQATPTIPAAEQEFFSVWSKGVVDSGGASVPTTFSITQAWQITQIVTYHYNGGEGAAPGTIGLKANDGTIYGPWNAVGMSGSAGPDSAWSVEPNVVIPAGSYTVLDSDPATWSQNSETNGAGMAYGIGVPVSNPSTSPATVTPGAPAAVPNGIYSFRWDYPAECERIDIVDVPVEIRGNAVTIDFDAFDPAGEKHFVMKGSGSVEGNGMLSFTFQTEYTYTPSRIGSPERVTKIDGSYVGPFSLYTTGIGKTDGTISATWYNGSCTGRISGGYFDDWHDVYSR